MIFSPAIDSRAGNHRMAGSVNIEWDPHATQLLYLLGFLSHAGQHSYFVRFEKDHNHS